ncbi:MAG: restriction endonuclease [Christensenellales bacterium]|jgi:restriction system protein
METKKREFPMPKKEDIEHAIRAILENKKLTRQNLIIECCKKLGLNAEEMKNRAPDSKFTAYKSIIGTVINDFENSETVTVTDNYYTVAKPITKTEKSALAAKVYPQKRGNKDYKVSFKEITNDAYRLYDELVSETEKLKERYLKELKDTINRYFAVSSSEFFEEACVNLICKIFNVDPAFGMVLGGSDDGGIDGVVRIVDELGFEKEIIYIQSKCRKALNKMTSATEVRQFYGAIQYKKARKAIVMTNARFHHLALQEVEGAKDIVLIDGNRLAELMIEHKFGVKEKNGLPVIDQKFFPKLD